MHKPELETAGHLARELEIACRLARKAGAAIESVREAGIEAFTKEDQSPVTQADLASDAILRAGLTEAFPEDGLLSEESGFRPGVSGRTWIIDPLDGTKAFIRGVEGYAVQIGLIDRGQPVLGVVYEPQPDRLYRAVTGGGAFLEAAGERVTRLRVSAHVDRAEMTLVASTSLRNSRRQQLVDTLGFAAGHPVRSVGVKVGHIVRRRADVYVSPHPVHFWDSCGPLVVLLESGGLWTHEDGRPPAFDLAASNPVHRGPFVVSNGTGQSELVREIGQVLGWGPSTG